MRIFRRDPGNAARRAQEQSPDPETGPGMKQRTSAAEQSAAARVAFWEMALQLARAAYRWGWWGSGPHSRPVRNFLWTTYGAVLDRRIAAGRDLKQLREQREDPGRAQG